MSAISALLTAPPNNFSTTLSAGIASNDLTIPLNSVSGLGTEGIGVLYAKDTSGNPTASSIEFIHWTNTSGNNLTLTDTGDRGVSGSASGAQAHTAGDTFEVWTHSSYYPRSALLAVLTSAGILDTTKVVDLTTAQTMTNKIFTSPVFNTGISGTAIDTDGTLAGNSDTKLASQKAIKTYVDSKGDWKTISATLTYSSVDAPTFVVGTSVDLTASIGVGMRIGFSQTTGGQKYFIVTAISASTMTLYGGTDYTLTNETVTSPVYSTSKAPSGFPMSPAKWSVTTTDTSDRTQASPTQNTWYNLGSITINIPIGVWDVYYQAVCEIVSGSVGGMDIWSTLSTANNSESDAIWTSRVNINASTLTDFFMVSFRKNLLTTASKTPYYLNARTAYASMTSINFKGSSAGRTIINAVCAYL